MALKFQPQKGDVVICDFSGFVAPEMIKIRPVVVVAKHRHNKKLVTVVPLSTTEPYPLQHYHYAMPINPLPDTTSSCWAKCDMIYTVSIDRLDRYKHRDQDGKRCYSVPQIPSLCLQNIQDALVNSLNLTHTRNVP